MSSSEGLIESSSSVAQKYRQMANILVQTYIQRSSVVCYKRTARRKTPVLVLHQKQEFNENKLPYNLRKQTMTMLQKKKVRRRSLVACLGKNSICTANLMIIWVKVCEQDTLAKLFNTTGSSSIRCLGVNPNSTNSKENYKKKPLRRLI